MITLTALLCLNAKKVLGQDTEFNNEIEKIERKIVWKIRFAIGFTIGFLVGMISLVYFFGN